MGNEFGEEVTIYVWPKGVCDESYGDDFYDKLTAGLASVGIEWESA